MNATVPTMTVTIRFSGSAMERCHINDRIEAEATGLPDAEALALLQAGL